MCSVRIRVCNWISLCVCGSCPKIWRNQEMRKTRETKRKSKGKNLSTSLLRVYPTIFTIPNGSLFVIFCSLLRLSRFPNRLLLQICVRIAVCLSVCLWPKVGNRRSCLLGRDWREREREREKNGGRRRSGRKATNDGLRKSLARKYEGEFFLALADRQQMNTAVGEVYSPCSGRERGKALNSPSKVE